MVQSLKLGGNNKGAEEKKKVKIVKTYKQFSEGLKDYINRERTRVFLVKIKHPFGKLFKDELKQMGKFKNPKTGKLEGGIFPES